MVKAALFIPGRTFKWNWRSDLFNARDFPVDMASLESWTQLYVVDRLFLQHKLIEATRENKTRILDKFVDMVPINLSIHWGQLMCPTNHYPQCARSSEITFTSVLLINRNNFVTKICQSKKSHKWVCFACNFCSQFHWNGCKNIFSSFCADWNRSCQATWVILIILL